MKKLALLALGACMFISTAQAQKQSGGESNLQVLFAPLGGTPISINGLTFRKFSADGTSAWRVNLFIGMTNNKTIQNQAGDTGAFPKTVTDMNGVDIVAGPNPEATKTTSSFTVGIRPGYEMHMAGTENLSPYWGAELIFSMTSAKVETEEIHVGDYTYTDSPSLPSSVAAPYQTTTVTRKGDGGSTTFGLNLIAGFDYYISSHLSLGAELGFGYSMTSMPDIEDQYVSDVTTNTLSGTTTTTTHRVTVKDKSNEVQGKSSQLGPNVVGQFKLGWLF